MENIEKMVQEALDSTKSAHKRIDRMEKRQDNLEELTNAFSVLQNEQEHIKTDVGEIKDDVKQLVSKPAKRWDGLIDKAIAVVVLLQKAIPFVGNNLRPFPKSHFGIRCI